MVISKKYNFVLLAPCEKKHFGGHVSELTESIQNNKFAKFITLFFMTLATLVLCHSVQAFDTPSTGSFAYNIYDISVNKVAKGPIGYVGGGWLVAIGATKLNEGWARALPFVIGGSCLLKIDELTTSLGALVH